MITFVQLAQEILDGKHFDGSITSPDGSVSTGAHSVYDFEVWNTSDRGLVFMCHDEPEELLTYEDVKEVFDMKQDDSLDQQLADCGLAV